MPSSSNSIGQCSICLSKLSSSNTFVITKCGHTFHQNCIIQWLKRSKSCPACRAIASESDVIKLFIQECEGEPPATRNEMDSENSLFIEKYGFVHRVMKECKCELFSYKNGDLQYRSSMDFDVNVHYLKEHGQIKVILQDKYIFATLPSQRFEILRKETNEKTVVTSNGTRYEYFNLPNYANRVKEMIQNTIGSRKNSNGTITVLSGSAVNTIRGDNDLVNQFDDNVKFYFSNFMVEKRSGKGYGGHVCFTIESTKHRNVELKIGICPEHEIFCVKHVNKNKRIRCTYPENRCSHMVDK